MEHAPSHNAYTFRNICMNCHGLHASSIIAHACPDYLRNRYTTTFLPAIVRYESYGYHRACISHQYPSTALTRKYQRANDKVPASAYIGACEVCACPHLQIPAHPYLRMWALGYWRDSPHLQTPVLVYAHQISRQTVDGRRSRGTRCMHGYIRNRYCCGAV